MFNRTLSETQIKCYNNNDGKERQEKTTTQSISKIVYTHTIYMWAIENVNEFRSCGLVAEKWWFSLFFSHMFHTAHWLKRQSDITEKYEWQMACTINGKLNEEELKKTKITEEIQFQELYTLFQI